MPKPIDPASLPEPVASFVAARVAAVTHRRWSGSRLHSHAYLVIRHDHYRALPLLDWLLLKDLQKSSCEPRATRISKANQDQAAMCPWCECAHVGEVQILRQERTLRRLRRRPDIVIIMPSESLVLDSIDVVPEVSKPARQRDREILVELEPHQKRGRPGTGRSSCADEAANAIAARSCSSVSVGKAARISSDVSPSAKLASTVRSKMRVPRNTGWPPQIAGLRSKNSSSFGAAMTISTIARMPTRSTRGAGRTAPTLAPTWLVIASANENGRFAHLANRPNFRRFLSWT